MSVTDQVYERRILEWLQEVKRLEAERDRLQGQVEEIKGQLVTQARLYKEELAGLRAALLAALNDQIQDALGLCAEALRKEGSGK